MKKATLVVFLVVSLVVGIISIVSTSLNLQAAKNCWCLMDMYVSQQCDNYCALYNTHCAGFELKSSDCHGELCNQTWTITCAKDKATNAGGAETCQSCIDQMGHMYNPGDDDDPMATGSTPLDASGKKMF